MASVVPRQNRNCRWVRAIHKDSQMEQFVANTELWREESKFFVGWRKTDTAPPSPACSQPLSPFVDSELTQRDRNDGAGRRAWVKKQFSIRQPSRCFFPQACLSPIPSGSDPRDSNEHIRTAAVSGGAH
jgi:hypothetical protein